VYSCRILNSAAVNLKLKLVCNNFYQFGTYATFGNSCNINACDVKYNGDCISGLAFVRGTLFDPAFVRARVLEGHESSKLPGSAHLPVPPIWSGEPGYWKGMSPPSYPAQPAFLRLQLGRAGPSIGRAQVLQATQFSPPFCVFNLVGQARVSEGHGVLQATQLSPPFCAINPDNLSSVASFQKGRTLDSLTATLPSRVHSATHRRLL
jgi:hypothetical protein